MIWVRRTRPATPAKHSHGHQAARPEAGDQPPGERRDDDHRRRHREDQQAGGGRRVPERALEVLGLEEDQAPPGADQRERGGAGAEVGAVAKQRELDDRLGDPVLDHPEGHHQRHAQPQHAEGPRRPEPPFGRLDQGQDERDQSRGEEHQAGEVEPVGRALVARLRHDTEHHGHPDCQHRDVDPEDQPPIDVHQQAADERADRQRQRRDRGPDPQRPRLLLSGEGVADDRQRERQHRRRADPLDHPAGDQRPLARRRPREHRASPRRSPGRS